MCGAQELNDKKPIINSTPDELHDPGNFIGLKTCYHHRRIAFRNQLWYHLDLKSITIWGSLILKDQNYLRWHFCHIRQICYRSTLIDKKCLPLISKNVDRFTKYLSLRKTRLYVLKKINVLLRMISFLTINSDSGQSILLKKPLAKCCPQHQTIQQNVFFFWQL